MDIAFLVISALAMVAIAIFTWKTWQISARQNKLLHDPDLVLYTWPGEGSLGRLVNFVPHAERISYSLVMVNGGTTPIVVNEIKEKLKMEDGTVQDVIMNFIPPPGVRPPFVFMVGLPWVVANQSFVICRRELKLEDVWEYLKEKRIIGIDIELPYYVGNKHKYVSKTVPIRVGFTVSV